MNRIIEITVNPKGETTVRTSGFAGSECREASKFVEKREERAAKLAARQNA